MSHLYIHIPFCQQRCGYCDFSTTTDLGRIDDYVAALCQDIKLLYARYPQGLKTLYFGGGTPSVLSIMQLQKIVKTIEATFKLPSEEFTIEVNPESFDRAKAAAYASFGIGRISMGMQAYQPHLLGVLDRRGGYPDVYRAVDALHQQNITNYNIDLIYGIPGQTVANVAETIDRIAELEAKHVSAYALKLEPTVPMAGRVSRGELIMPDDDSAADMLDVVIDQLANMGIARYEVSNFAVPGWHSRHNSAYWSGVDTLGAGLAAVYKMGHCRYANVIELSDYLKAVQCGQLPYQVQGVEQLTTEDMAYEYTILNLRTTLGLDTTAYHRLFDIDFSQRYDKWIDRFTDRGVLKRAGNRFYLTRHGLNIANYVLSEL